MKTARFIREIPKSNGWWVTQYLFKVTPPMAWDENATYRRGRLLHDSLRTWPNRMKGPWRDENGDWIKERLIYRHSTRHHTTAFVIASAADLGAMMKNSYDEIRSKALIKGDLETLKIFKEDRHKDFKPEVYLFPCDKFGHWKHGGEMEGSQRGTLDHRLPFRDMGYSVIEMPVTPKRYKTREEWAAAEFPELEGGK